jgi:hypothetical protein
MNEEVEISVSLSSEFHDDPPNFQLFLNDVLISGGTISAKMSEKSSEEFKWTGQLPEGEHVIKIIFSGKTDKDTEIDAEGNIIKDKLLNVHGISIDEIELGNLVYKLCNFYPDKKIRSDLPYVIPNLTCIGYNGVWILKFNVPTYLWLLEHY